MGTNGGWLGVESLGVRAAFKGLGLRLGGLIGRVAALGWAFGKGLVADLARISGAMVRFGGPILHGVVGGGLNFVKLGLKRVGMALLASPFAAAGAAASPLSQPPALSLDTRPALSGASSARQSAGSTSSSPSNNTPTSLHIDEIIINSQPGQVEEQIADLVLARLERLMRVESRTDGDLHDGGILFGY